MNQSKRIKYRRSLRYPEYDYSQNGAYFITICTRNKEHLFGEVESGEMILNDIGRVAEQCWHEIPEHYPYVSLDAFVVMPNHIHGIFIIERPVVGVQNFEPLQHNAFQKIIPRSVGAIVRGYKIGVTKWCRTYTDVNTIWQRNYYEHIIRSDQEWNVIVEYIEKNPEMWKQDELYY